MFNKIINTIYDSFSHPNSTKSKEIKQTNNKTPDKHNSSTISDQQDLHSLLNIKSEPIARRRASVSESIPIGKANTSRRISTFGISNISCDDYVQKDLISSSWS